MMRFIFTVLFLVSGPISSQAAFAPNADFNQSGFVDAVDLTQMLDLGGEGDANYHLHGLLGIQARDVYDFAAQWFMPIDPLKSSAASVDPSTAAVVVEPNEPEVSSEPSPPSNPSTFGTDGPIPTFHHSIAPPEATKPSGDDALPVP